MEPIDAIPEDFVEFTTVDLTLAIKSKGQKG